ncbi:hypothetical protein MIR68_000156 [Amoeboaphelidium protococcarum]|nr:hypothetical protein MIR68_000156 [Amoeboaphelidium protococcarum]KAI3652077.1 hypothetical protein MP228_003380 [Amoeboaphelidium protococcarum]
MRLKLKSLGVVKVDDIVLTSFLKLSLVGLDNDHLAIEVYNELLDRKRKVTNAFKSKNSHASLTDFAYILESGKFASDLKKRLRYKMK